MNSRIEAFAIAAEQCVGVQYRLYGRDPAFGLDCVGLFLHALRASCGTVPGTPRYGLRNTRYDYLPSLAKAAGFEAVTDDMRRGDCLCAVPGAGQMHIVIALGRDLLVHADASQRKVVWSATPIMWPVVHHFRFTERG
ncbi:NlpC/P60 family protein [Pontixanthobacter sp.]|uniref:NlpC/P60 family protein n=1 Tax=Pontixanthobacter sp. TaxID=2792078 RepID=UPI003C7A50DB